MTVEAATYIDTLNASYPASGDQRNEGDNHIRLIKATIKATFPNLTGPVTATQTELNQVDGVVPLTTTTSGQMVLMSAVSVSGSPSAIDFIDGSGGVVFSTSYDEYLIVYSNIRHASSSNAKLRLGSSVNGASGPFTVTTSGVYINLASSTLTGSSFSGTYLPVVGDLANASTTASPGSAGFIRIHRAVGGPYTHFSVDWQGNNSTGGTVRGSIDTVSVNGLRLYWDTGNFANTGTFKLYGRMV